VLALNFNLTPAQVEMLLICAYGHYHQIDPLRGDSTIIPSFDSPNFVGVGTKLIAKGLMTHDNSRNPTWLVTDRGRAVADLIVDKAQAMVALRKKAKKIPVKVKR
jgi:hypothetical protein